MSRPPLRQCSSGSTNARLISKCWTEGRRPASERLVPALPRLSLTDFRNYRDALIEPGPGFVLLSGPNGAGKTNVLEAVSLLTPGRGLRQVPISEMARSDGPGGWAVAANLTPRPLQGERESRVATGRGGS